MSLSRQEVVRLLPAAVEGHEVDGDTVRFFDAGRAGTLGLVPLASLRLGSLVLPRLRIEVALEGASEAEGEAFLGRLLRAFLRSGG